VQGQFSQNVDGKVNTVAALTKRVIPAGSAPTRTQTAQTPVATPTRTTPVTPATPAAPVTPTTPAAPATAQPTAPAAPLIQGTIVPGNNLAAKLAWLQKSADSHNTYILEVNANESIAPTRLYYEGALDITVVLRGNGANRTLRLSTNGKMFEVGRNVTFILENNITLQGHNGNNDTMVYVSDGTFKMNAGTAIIGNNRTNGDGAGVYVGPGTFELTGGTISGNSTRGSGGGVFLNGGNNGTGTFTMSGGSISGNTASNRGGGVILDGGSFTMTGGTISGNTAKQGGGVWINGGYMSMGPFTMRGGTITGNTAHENGGGVFARGSLKKTGGTITGYNSDQANGNVVRDESGDILARKGHAVFVSADRRKENTAGPEVNLDNYTAAGWD